MRLHHVCGQGGHRIAQAVGISRYTAAEYLRRAAVVGIIGPVPPKFGDAALERKLFALPGAISAAKVRPQPDSARLHAKLRRPRATLLSTGAENRTGSTPTPIPLGWPWRRTVSASMKQLGAH
jgi:DNA-binding transcriptional regulator LsrR (DeoR family)